MKKKLENVLKTTIQKCFSEALLIEAPIPDFVIEVPNNPEHGHFATNLPMALASTQKRNPREIARVIVDQLRDDEHIIERVEIAGPGFVNFRIRPEPWYRLLEEILTLRSDYGRSPTGREQKVLIEYVSANPTGPLHLGHGRGAALGDTLSRVLSFNGCDVVREFYINDAGRQISLLGESIFSRWKQTKEPGYPFPENGYFGDYIFELATRLAEEVDLDRLPPEEATLYCTRRGREIMLGEIKEDLARFRVPFDVWYSESDLFSSGLLQEALDEIREKGHLYEEGGALWIKTSEFGDDKDRVVRKSDGEFTYFASDIAYHLEKRKRGFTKAINIWGADHHGYVPRMKAALKAYGFPDDWLSVMLIQLVKLWKGGEEIKMSKRAGRYVTLRELVDEVGVDAVRFVFLTKNHDSTLDFDIDRVKREDSENPVYYVQYAHARICSIFRKAADEGLALPKDPHSILGRLVLDEEMALIRFMAAFPSLLEDIFKTLEPHRLTYYLTDLAALFHKYFNLGNKNPEQRVITGDRQLSGSRMCLIEAIRIVIGNGLGLLGIHAPQKM
jgi:arginyl-tRNA synthetase